MEQLELYPEESNEETKAPEKTQQEIEEEHARRVLEEAEENREDLRNTYRR